MLVRLDICSSQQQCQKGPFFPRPFLPSLSVSASSFPTFHSGQQQMRCVVARVSSNGLTAVLLSPDHQEIQFPVSGKESGAGGGADDV